MGGMGRDPCCAAACWVRCAEGEETRREHRLELRAYLGIVPFGLAHLHQAMHTTTDLALQTDKGVVLAASGLDTLRQQHLPLCQTSCRLRFSADYPHGKRHFMHRKPHSHHSPEFKQQALLKARHRGTRSLLSLAGELNMSPGTLKRWVLDSGKAGEQAPGKSSPVLDGPAASWSPSQRLTALQESYALNGAALAGWCRERCVFEHQLM